MLLGLLVFALLWLAQLSDTSLVAPFDNIEQLTWARGLAWGYYKHPPLPTWLIAGPVALWGPAAWESYLLGAAMTLSALALMWQLLARLRGVTHAHVALLAALCITYYNGRLNYYNHNIVLLLASSACASLCWQAVTTRRRRWWLALGLALGLGALAKYQIAVTGLCVLAFALQQGALRDRDHQRGLLLAGGAALLVFSPHLLWLVEHDFSPVHYALSTSLGVGLSLPQRALDTTQWLLDQVLNRASVAWLLLAWLAWQAGRAQPGAPSGLSKAPEQHRPPADAARALLLIWGGLPLLFMPAVGLLLGADLQLQWGTAFLLFAVPAAMELTAGARWHQTPLRRALPAFVLLQALLLLVKYMSSPIGPARWRDHHWRSFDALRLASQIEGPARRLLGGRITVVVGPANEAGALALADHPLVLIDHRFDESSWVDPALVARCGALQLGPLSQLPHATPLAAPLPGWGWQILPPQAGAPACDSEDEAKWNAHLAS
jgi:4-amino-4-deoxy-L-arabinose transferase-like glycosyltransferase